MQRGDLGRLGIRINVAGREYSRLRTDFRRPSRRQRAYVECPPSSRLGMAEFQSGALRDLVPPQCRSAGRFIGNCTFLHWFGNQAGARISHCPCRSDTQRGPSGNGLCAIPGRSAARCAETAVRCPELNRMVRGCGALSASRSCSVELLAPHKIAAYLARKPSHARRRVAEISGNVVPAAGRRQWCPSCANVRPLPASRHAFEEPAGRLADGAI